MLASIVVKRIEHGFKSVVRRIAICLCIWIEICVCIVQRTENNYYSLKDPLRAVSVVQPLICSSAAIFVVHHTILEFDEFLHVIQENEIFLDMCVVCDFCTPIRHPLRR
jgi:hypothetical protein